MTNMQSKASGNQLSVPHGMKHTINEWKL